MKNPIQDTSLCMPGDGRSCFFCCPPIRPPDYDPLSIREKIIVQLDDNTRNFKSNLKKPQEIYGERCWGLGYLDKKKTMIGCLLHPSLHQGEDLRHLTGYGEKCARERCLEDIKFSSLPQKDAQFFLDLSRGLDAFHYASRTFNPTFGMLMWGPGLLKAIAEHEQHSSITLQRFKEKYRTFLNILEYRIDAYLVDQIIIQKGLDWFFSKTPETYLYLRKTIIKKLKSHYPYQKNKNNLPYVHEHPISLELSRFLKFGLNIWQENLEVVYELVSHIEKSLQKVL